MAEEEARVRLLANDRDFTRIIPLVYQFVESTDGVVTMHQCMSELSLCFGSDKSIGVVGELNGEMFGYLCGYFVGMREFLVSQAYSDAPALSRAGYDLLEETARARGAQTMLMHTRHPVRVFRRYGFEFDRYLLVKQL